MEERPSEDRPVSPSAAGPATVSAVTWELVEQQVQAYLKACGSAPSGTLPAPAEFLPAGSFAQRRMVFVELLKLSLQRRLSAGEPARIEDDLPGPENLLPVDSVPADLVLEEYRLRRGQGESVSHEEYLRRFPRLADRLSHWLSAAEQPERAPSSEQAVEFAQGQVVDDFVILQPLGRGAFAQVYLARQESLRRLVALKVVRHPRGEPATLARLDHPHIVRVFDQRQMAGGLYLLYMEFVPGGTLEEIVECARSKAPHERCGTLVLQCIDQRLLAAGQPAPEDSLNRRCLSAADWTETVCRLGMQLAAALDYAHHRGVLHRDIKPANVLMSAAGMPKLADFNISYDASHEQISAATYFGGSLVYMSPEQLAAIDPDDPTCPDDLDGRSDLYSLAVLLWELWRGARPWGPEASAADPLVTVREMRRRREHPPTEAPEGRATAQAVVLGEALRAALAFHRSSRPATARELAGRLRLALRPEAARLFYPPRGSLAWIVTRIWPIAFVALAVLVPNAVAGLFNYLYNEREIVALYPEVQRPFEQLAATVNAIAFPLGIGLSLWFGWRLQRAYHRAPRGMPPDDAALDLALGLGNLAAWIGISLWTIAAFIYPSVLLSLSPSFQLSDAIHFFVSLILCGCVAAAYPFLVLAWAGITVYYPHLIRREIADFFAAQRLVRIQRRAGRFLLMAAGVPLVALALLAATPDGPRDVLLIAVAAGAFGLLFAFFAYQRIVATARVLDELLSERDEVGNQPRAS